MDVKKQVLRVIDANLNRSREGLRVCEDIARFILNSQVIAKTLKSVRHDITDLMKNFPVEYGALLDSRDSASDIGRCSKLKSELRRLDCLDIFSANIERVKESLRVLEEISKIIDKDASCAFSELRFKIYQLEKRSVKKIGTLRER